jgi:pSer/pThr/pTyr-binding forkhead associated (FHA) protein
MVADITLDGVFAARWRLNRLLALAGRADGLTVQLIHPSVSSYHCSFVATPTGVWVVDLLSRSGIRLNDQPVAFARVRPGDTLSIGSYEFHFLPSDASASGEIPSSVLDHPQPAPSGAIVREADVVSTRPIDQQAILPIIQQFGLIHQQMMDQFQQTMMMTVQMFGKLHSEQLALIRDELDQLMTLTRELEQARHELASRKQLTVAPAVPSPRVESQSPPAQPVAPAPENRRVTETRVGPSQEEMQEWLTERINKLEQERKSLWQRLLSNLSGG